ncbi:AraC family transcriptional regulator [Pseudoalteromonas sp. 2CM28B]|uniref:helix-turn-helix transcriptional regulator n=1 Tax=Pseudoalteromonas sp. 2CM28B TaxID=2929851 RepID=UPI0020BE6C74|nr:AraC family transcriptional regulator [Pseudoalteromonas sp. 2CM28B]MCK8131354.1 AraC family transcriptional regulator [Pseudoalteromonas sp. 2CM28B]
MFNRPNYQDPLSEMLLNVHLNVTISINEQFCGDWLLGDKAKRTKWFHVISHGSCSLIIDDQEAQLLNSGDLVIYTRDVKYKLVAGESTSCEAERLKYEGGLVVGSTGILCGSFTYQNNSTESVLAALPPILVIKNNEHTKHWIGPLIKLIQYENCNFGLGSELIIKQLIESLFVHSIRSYIENSTFKAGIFNLMSDNKLSRALSVIQHEPQNSWTVEKLAKECAMSRSSFATRFLKISGWTPIGYLTWWRMQKAWSLLKNGELVSNVAESVGYRSEASFAHAFKKQFNMGPGEVRKKFA